MMGITSNEALIEWRGATFNIPMYHDLYGLTSMKVEMNKTRRLIEVELTQGKSALVDESDYDIVSKYRWHVRKDGRRLYAGTNIEGKVIGMHRLILGVRDGEECDHISGDGLDNRRCNLRIVTNQQNMMNMRKRFGCSSIYKGVSRSRNAKRWIAKITDAGFEEVDDVDSLLTDKQKEKLAGSVEIPVVDVATPSDVVSKSSKKKLTQRPTDMAN
jgi:hypothetical protein